MPPLKSLSNPAYRPEPLHPPLGPGWLHEMKSDGFRLKARRDGRRVRLLTRRGYDWTNRFALIANAVAGLHRRSCLIDGEAVVCDDQGIPDFELLIRKRRYASAQLYAFDLLEVDGEDLRASQLKLGNECSPNC
jgi:bifunctional non-homologous end joining protein LigD